MWIAGKYTLFSIVYAVDTFSKTRLWKDGGPVKTVANPRSGPRTPTSAQAASTACAKTLSLEWKTRASPSKTKASACTVLEQARTRAEDNKTRPHTHKAWVPHDRELSELSWGASLPHSPGAWVPHPSSRPLRGWMGCMLFAQLLFRITHNTRICSANAFIYTESCDVY